VKQAVSIVIGGIITLACLYFALRGIEWSHIQTELEAANYWLLIPMLLGTLVFFWLKALRWRWLLSSIKNIPTSEIFPVIMIGFMGNNVLPMHLGELMRIVVLARQQKIPDLAILTTVVLERVFDMMMILLLFSLGLLFCKIDFPMFKQAATGMAALAISGVVVLGSYIIWTDHVLGFMKRVMSWMFFLPVSFRQKIIQLFETAAHGLHVLKNPRLTLAITINSLVQWLLAVWFIQLALDMMHLYHPFTSSMVVMGSTAIGAAIPSLPGYFGTIQACFRAALEPMGVSESKAFAASLLYQLPQYVLVTAMGLWYLQRTGIKWGEFFSYQKQHEHDLAHTAADSIMMEQIAHVKPPVEQQEETPPPKTS
jgi:hypothetical protein